MIGNWLVGSVLFFSASMTYKILLEDIQTMFVTWKGNYTTTF